MDGAGFVNMYVVECVVILLCSALLGGTVMDWNSGCLPRLLLFEDEGLSGLWIVRWRSLYT